MFKLILGFHITNLNYRLAYEVLRKRYQNYRLLTFVYLNKILNFSSLQSERIEILFAITQIG